MSDTTSHRDLDQRIEQLVREHITAVQRSAGKRSSERLLVQPVQHGSRRGPRVHTGFPQNRLRRDDEAAKAPAPMGSPGWPEFARSIMSTEKKAERVDARTIEL